MIIPSNRVLNFKDSIFGVMSKMANEAGAVNLSQGFPDFDGPSFVKDYAIEAINKGHNQYAPFPGTIELRSSVARYLKRFYDLNYSKDTEISVSAGATEGIFLAVLSVVNPGDEVIVFEPFYDSYISSIEVAGGIPRVVTLKSPDFTFSKQDLEALYSDKTKCILFNNPNNPTGRVFNDSELKILANFAVEKDLCVISDEVYEFLTFDGLQHTPLATLPGMKDRTIGLYSAGKTFGLTGWKIGWVCAPEKLTIGLRKLHQYITFSVSTPMQLGIARSLDELESYIPSFQKSYQEKRDLFYTQITQLGFDLKKPEGTYFMMVPIHQKTKLNDVEFASLLIQKNKVAAIPPSAFYLESDEGSHFLRFCFAKELSTLNQAIKQLKVLPV